jgi:lysozyme
MIKGIDVSSVQGVVDWHRVKEAGIRFVYLKATEGLAIVDSRYRTNIEGALAAQFDGVGAYHFCKPSLSKNMRSTKEDALAEVRKLAAKCENLGRRVGELPPALDIEIFDGQSPGKVAEWLVTAVAEVKVIWGRDPVMYTGIPMAPALKLAPELASLALWIPAYPQRQDPATKKWSPALGWEVASTRKAPCVAPWTAATVWQFSGGDINMSGNVVPGIDGWTDCNLYLRGEANFLALCNRGTTPAIA